MSVKFLRNKKVRLNYSKFEIERLAIRYIIRSQKINIGWRLIAATYLSKVYYVCRPQLTNHCFISARRRGFIRFSGLSRQQMRLLARDGQLPFISKSS